MKLFSLILTIFSLLILSGPLSAAEEEKPNDMYQWQVQKYPKVKKQFPILVDENSSIIEKPAGINYKAQDKIKKENLQKKKKEIEAREEEIIKEDNRLIEEAQKGKTSKTEDKDKKEKKISKKEEKKTEKTVSKEDANLPSSETTSTEKSPLEP